MRSYRLLSCALLGLVAAQSEKVAQKQPISSDLYQTFIRYTNFTSAATYQPCPVPVYGATAVAYINETSTDTQATIFRDDTQREAIVSFPGSATLRDYALDVSLLQVPYVSSGITCASCAVHVGFLTAWNSVASQIQTVLNQTLASHQGYQVIITGHSLGAAIAQLAYASLKSQKFPVAAAYTMGQPRIGNVAYADYIDKLSGATDTTPGDFYRITHATDPVPQIPPELLGYRHSRTEYWEEGELVQNATTTYRCFGQEPSDCSKGHQNLLDADENEAHQRYSSIFIPDPASCGLS